MVFLFDASGKLLFWKACHVGVFGTAVLLIK
jgi:hypothetical protein